MPYRKYKRRRNYRRATIAATRKRQAKFINKVIDRNLEKKYFDTDLTTTVGTGGNMFQISAIPSGTTDITRVGDKIKLLSLRFRLNIAFGDTINILRMLVFQWHPDNGAYGPSVSNLLQYNGSVQDVMSPYNHDAGSQFSIIYDRYFNLAENSSNADMLCLANFNFARKTRKMRFVRPIVKYHAAGTSGQDNLWVLFLSDSAAVPNPAVVGYCRLIYVDA